MKKVKIAIFDLTGCQGCQFHLLSLNELLLDVFQDFEITNWRLLSEEEKEDFDIAFIEGAVTTPGQIKLLKKIRETSKVVVALGACAISGNIFAQLTPKQRKNLASKIYDKSYILKAKFLAPVEKFIKVDEKITGCPPDVEKFKKLLAKFKKEKVSSKIKSVVPPEFVAKIEGHGRLKINFKQKEVEFEIEESERLVEGLVLGKNLHQAPAIAARICGICPTAHNLCSWKTIEAALGIRPAPEAIVLREILLAAQMVKSHLLHLFFLVLPDYAGLKSSVQLSQKYPAEFHLMLNIKRVSEKILQVVGGSTVFPTNTTLAGFLQIPEINQLLSLRDDIYSVIDESQDLVKLFASFENASLESKALFLTTSPPKNYPLYQSKIRPQIKEIVRALSAAKLGVLAHGEIVKTGALARTAKFANRLNPKAKEALQSLQLDPSNPFNNNPAQAVEILHFLEEMVRLIGDLIDKDLSRAKGVLDPNLSGLPAEGEACLEAPRGVLIHKVSLDRKGKILDYNIVPPTQINLASLESDTQRIVKEKTWSAKKMKRETEKLIRAFDPCITCAVH